MKAGGRTPLDSTLNFASDSPPANSAGWEFMRGCIGVVCPIRFRRGRACRVWVAAELQRRWQDETPTASTIDGSSEYCRGRSTELHAKTATSTTDAAKRLNGHRIPDLSPPSSMIDTSEPSRC